jgi:hypothetical protein
MCGRKNVGLEEVDHELWHVYCGPLKHYWLHDGTMGMEDALGKLQRLHRANK